MAPDACLQHEAASFLRVLSEHVSQLALVTAAVGATSALKVKVQDGPELYVCRLSEGRTDYANLDLVLDEYTEFTVEGAALHITGRTPYL